MISSIHHLPRSGLAYNIGWGLAYILGAWIGLELAVPPSSISPIWPAAGVALAALLVQGNRVLPGLFIGCYVVQLTSFYDFSSRPAILQSLLIALVASSGSILQAWTGQFLVRRRPRSPDVADLVGGRLPGGTDHNASDPCVRRADHQLLEAEAAHPGSVTAGNAAAGRFVLRFRP